MSGSVQAGVLSSAAAGLQPLLNDDLIVFRAPTQVWSAHDGSIGGRPIHGVYHSDVRLFSALDIRVGGASPEPISHHRDGAGAATFVSLLRALDDRGADPRVRLDRIRRVDDGLVTETLTLSSAIADPIDTALTLTLRPDFADMQTVKAGLAGAGHAASVSGAAGAGAHSGTPASGSTPASSGTPASGSTPASSGAPVATVTEQDAGGQLPDRTHFSSGTAHATLTAPGAHTTRAPDGSTTSTWRIHVAPHSATTVTFTLALHDTSAVVQGAPASPRTTEARSGAAASPRSTHRPKPSIRSGDSRLALWLHSALDDLDALQLVTRDHADEPFLAAGAPWFFTLFGRDSLWAARFMLPFGTELAASTLTVLARLQGTKTVADTAEQPGKIMHELRARELLIPGEDVSLPPLYYGTVDATALWIILLHDAWTWGLDDQAVRALLPNLRAALAWMRDYGDSDGDGFLEYADTTGHGLANQGWKDSGDSIQWRDGRLAEGPIALCEVQAYAYQAAVDGAALLAHFAPVPDAGSRASRAGDVSEPALTLPADEAAEWLAWAAALKARFADRFWIDSPDGAYPAVALDAQKRRVDTVTSNIGHLLGTGILSPDQARLVAARLVSPELSSGFGLRTMSTDSAGYWPLSYHGGSVWAHDTAIAIAGLGREGLTAEASVLIEGLLAAAAGFDYRMPELHSGDPSTSTSRPVAYPAACRPQAWSAAAAVSVLSTALGLAPDARAGALAVNPIRPAVAGTLHVEGLRFAGSSVTLDVDASGALV